jgi:YVTN family beta-propeller protein
VTALTGPATSTVAQLLCWVVCATRRIAFPGANCCEPQGIDIAWGRAWIYTVDARTLRPGRVVVTAPGTIGVAVDAPRHEVWVTNQTANSVSVVDEKTLRVLATIRVGTGPALLVPAPRRTHCVRGRPVWQHGQRDRRGAPARGGHDRGGSAAARPRRDGRRGSSPLRYTGSPAGWASYRAAGGGTGAMAGHGAGTMG